VGKALVNVLSPLPFAVSWIDSRDEIFPEHVPENVMCEHSDPVQAAVRDLAPHSRVLIMSFSHAEDLDIVAACLQRLRDRRDLTYVGLIGSRTKWATFRHRLQERGFRPQELAQVTCPIGVPGVPGKQPEVIAVAVAAQLLQAPLP
jgi:xanthine dehydrogenase accessory factor